MLVCFAQIQMLTVNKHPTLRKLFFGINYFPWKLCVNDPSIGALFIKYYENYASENIPEKYVVMPLYRDRWLSSVSPWIISLCCLCLPIEGMQYYTTHK